MLTELNKNFGSGEGDGNITRVPTTNGIKPTKEKTAILNIGKAQENVS